MDEPQIECRRCHKVIRIPCSMELFNKIMNRGNQSIQTVAPGMMPEYREMFLTDYCPDCWNELFSDEE